MSTDNSADSADSAEPQSTPAWPAPKAPPPHTRPANGAPVPGAGWPEETGGPRGLEPTRYGDWEQNGICRDF